MTTNLHPLTPAVFYILLCLYSGEKHGYEIMKQVKSDSNNMVSMGNGTLYGSLKRMLDDGLIEISESNMKNDNRSRKYYRLTDLGKTTLKKEMARYVDTVKTMRSRKLLQGI